MTRPPFLFIKLFCRQDGGIVTPPTLPKPHYPSRFSYCNRLYALICFRIGTIPLAFRRGAGLPLPLHQSLLFPLIFAKEHLSLALLAPPVTPSLSIPTTFSKAHQPLRPAPRPCLPSKKVRCCHPKKFGRLPEGLLSYRTNSSQNRTIPCPAPRPCLPSKKGRWHGCRGFSTCCTVFR